MLACVGYSSRYCYKLVTQRMTWLDAATYCKEKLMNSNLVVILNEQQQEEVVRYMKSIPGQ